MGLFTAISPKGRTKSIAQWTNRVRDMRESYGYTVVRQRERGEYSINEGDYKSKIEWYGQGMRVDLSQIIYYEHISLLLNTPGENRWQDNQTILNVLMLDDGQPKKH